jgi:iron complex transport system substrate-binding protein
VSNELKGYALILVSISLIAVVISGIALYLIYAQTQTLTNLIAGESARLDSISSHITALKEEVGNIKENVSRLSSNIAGVQSRISELSSKLSLLGEKESSLEHKILDLEKKIEEAKYPITVTDALGRSVTISHKPVRIVSAAPSITETLFLIGAWNQVVGVDQFSNYPPIVNELKKNGTLAVIGGFATLNIEEILKIKPDLIITSTGVQEKYARELSDMGLTVIVMRTSSISDVFNDILTLGVITGHPEKAVDIVNSMRETIIETREKVTAYLNATGVEPVKVYYEIFPDYWTVGGGSYINDLIELAGGVNIFSNVTNAYFVTSPEAVLKNDPEIILTNYNYGQFGTPQELVNHIASRQGWSNITAVKNGHIYVIQGTLEDIIDRPGPRVAIGVEALARIFYPQAFNIEEIPQTINDTVLESWGINLSAG